MIQRYANPARFNRLADRLLPFLACGCAATLGVGLWLALVASPADYQQGQTVRIMYVHVPAAWMALAAYTFIAAASATGLIWKHPLAHLAAPAAAPIGAGFTLVCLLTGSLWGKPMWGTWWEWDARMTSELVLLFLYLGYIAMYDAFQDPRTGARAAAILAIVGVVNIPIIHFSVKWWHSLHQASTIMQLGPPKIDTEMLVPLLMAALGFMAWFGAALLLRLRGAVLESERDAAWVRKLEHEDV
jgi:heme exporter protein C